MFSSPSLPHVKALCDTAGDTIDAMERGFIALFYANIPEYIGSQYSSSELLAEAHQAWLFFADYHPGQAKIRFYDSDEDAAEEQSSTLEILIDDLPFLVDSVLEYLAFNNIAIHWMAHPILTVKRNASGQLEDLYPCDGEFEAVSRQESFIHIVTDRLEDRHRESFTAKLGQITADVRLAVQDWQPTLRHLEAVAERMSRDDDNAEVVAFIKWLCARDFIFLGLREFSYRDGILVADHEKNLGLYRDPKVTTFHVNDQPVDSSEAYLEILKLPERLFITKADLISRVHRITAMDMVAIKHYGANGVLIGETRVLGIFTHFVYSAPLSGIPFIRNKAAELIKRSHFDPKSHDGRAFIEGLARLPRTDVFHWDIETLFALGMDVLRLKVHPRTRLCINYDALRRYASVLAYISRNRYSTSVRVEIGKLLSRHLNGWIVSFTPSFEFGTFVRVHFIIERHNSTDPLPDIDVRVLEQQVIGIIRTWSDDFSQQLKQTLNNPAQERFLVEAYGDGFSAAYKEDLSASTAVDDVLVCETLTLERPEAFRIEHGSDDRLAIILVCLGEQVAPSQLLPMLENMDFVVHDSEHSLLARTRHRSTTQFCRHTIMVTLRHPSRFDFERARSAIEGVLHAVFRGSANNDRFNQLAPYADLKGSSILILRACAAYIQQLKVPYRQDYIADILAAHPSLSGDLIALFEARLNPANGIDPSESRIKEIHQRILDAIDEIAGIDADTLFRHYTALIMAMSRCSFYQHEGSDLIAFKILPQQLEFLPEPRPYAEIFAYSPRLEGIHMRGGKIARGGIRWSERSSDYRTEILGLFKAQAVKNAVIVPTGAKGGFLCKNLTAAMSAKERYKEISSCYKLFIESMLAMTDNRVGKAIVAPTKMIRHDDDDPYFVVAADKGTATFSDLANEISMARGFWLDDAFASGGGAGYDHKKMGITARGAWKAVERHFSECDIDIDRDGIRVAGIGDMSGDVFGNGMLLSRGIRLVAAFDHRHIFLDPDPDVEISFAERQRLFDLTTSSWDDYDRSKLSNGGAIFSRSLKKLSLSPECCALLGVSDPLITVNACLRRILRASVDLLWFGGIGTYIRADRESDAEAGDRANDAIRVTADDVGARVIGEGANLGLTQLARIDYARRGGKINTDAIDNSAGVNCSDVEVNIKIALARFVAEAHGARKLERPARDRLLVEMTDQVAELVLANNTRQTLGISLAEQDQLREASFHSRLISRLERTGTLNRSLEYLPEAIVLQERLENGEGLSRPEIAVITAYAKNDMFQRLMQAPELKSASWLHHDLLHYFPQQMRDSYAEALIGHPLAAEISATLLANDIINRCGSGFAARLDDIGNADIMTIAQAYIVARESFAHAVVMDQVDALKMTISTKTMHEFLLEECYFMRRMILWFVDTGIAADAIEETIETYREGFSAILNNLEAFMDDSIFQRTAVRRKELVAEGMPDPLARRLAVIIALDFAPGIIRTATMLGCSVNTASRLHSKLIERNAVGRLMRLASRLPSQDYYDRVALQKCIREIEMAQMRALSDVIDLGGDDAAVEAWLTARSKIIGGLSVALASAETVAQPSLARVVVLIRYMDLFFDDGVLSGVMPQQSSAIAR